MSPRNTAFDMGLPPFRGAVRQIILASTAIYAVLLLLLSFKPDLANLVFTLGVLQPAQIHQGWLWQFVTYAFMYRDPLDFVLSLVGIYFIGGAVEDQIGTGRFYNLFFTSLIVAAIFGYLLSLTGQIAQGIAMGSGAAADAILMVFYLLNRNAPIMLFPIPIQIPVKWIVVGIAALETAYLLLSHFALQFCVVLLGLAAFGRIPLVHAFPSSRSFAGTFRTNLWHAQLVLSLEASPRRQEVSGVHAQTRSHRVLRRIRQLQTTRRQARRWPRRVGELKEAIGNQQ
jgi:membrane associated rhomboid family serine protease